MQRNTGLKRNSQEPPKRHPVPVRLFLLKSRCRDGAKSQEVRKI